MKRHALPLVAGLVTFLTVASGGIAYALWSDLAEQTISASSAEIAVAMAGTDAATGLAVGYNEAEDRFANSGAVTITNQGTRDAWYSVTAEVTDQSVNGLQDVIRFGGYVVATVEECVPTSAPAQTLAGGSATVSNLTLTPVQLAPSQSVIVCLETWLPEAEITAFGSTTIDLVFSSHLRYTAYEDSGVQQTRTTSSAVEDAVSVQQNVITEDLALLFENPIGRYWVANTYYDAQTDDLVSIGTVCKAGGLEQPARHDGVVGPCTGDVWNSQWRLVPVPGETNVRWILRAVNNYSQPTTPRWTITDLASPITNVAPDNNDPDQKWVIEGRGDGTYRIKAFSATDSNGHPICIATGGPLWSGLTNLVPAACSGQAVTHGFRFDLIGYPVPQTRLDGNGDRLYPNGYTLTCGGNANSRGFSWMNSDEYQGEVKHRLRVIEHGGATLFEYLQNGANSPSFNVANNVAALETWYQNNAGGNFTSQFTIIIEQQITELGAWAQITVPMTAWMRHFATNDNRLYCIAPASPVPANPGFQCSGGNYWSASSGNEGLGLVLNSGEFDGLRAAASYRVSLGTSPATAEVVGSVGPPGYSWMVTKTPSSKQAFWSAHQGAQQLILEYRLGSSGDWLYYTHKNVTVGNANGGWRTVSGC